MSDPHKLDHDQPYPKPHPANHNLIYTALLGAIGFFLTISCVEILWIGYRTNQPPQSQNTLELVALINGIYALLCISTMFIRLLFPRGRKFITLMTNIVSLVYFPFGTALAIYGFMKVDKPDPGFLAENPRITPASHQPPTKTPAASFPAPMESQ
jgi:hypothetical protein